MIDTHGIMEHNMTQYCPSQLDQKNITQIYYTDIYCKSLRFPIPSEMMGSS
jgi:hypothetical protein